MSAELLVGAGSPPPSASPLRAGGGMRFALSRELRLEAQAEAALGSRPALSMSGRWCPSRRARPSGWASPTASAPTQRQGGARAPARAAPDRRRNAAATGARDDRRPRRRSRGRGAERAARDGQSGRRRRSHAGRCRRRRTVHVHRQARPGTDDPRRGRGPRARDGVGHARGGLGGDGDPDAAPEAAGRPDSRPDPFVQGRRPGRGDQDRPAMDAIGRCTPKTAASKPTSRPGRYEVTITAPGYETQRRRVEVEQNGVTLLNADLRSAR